MQFRLKFTSTDT